MSSKTKSITAVLIVLALVAGVGMTKVGSKYKTQDKVNLIFANVTSNSAKKAGEKFKELVAKKGFEKLTIKMITDAAGVIRPTFYNYFQVLMYSICCFL